MIDNDKKLKNIKFLFALKINDTNSKTKMSEKWHIFSLFWFCLDHRATRDNLAKIETKVLFN